MAEFQKKNAREDLLSALNKLGLQVGTETRPSGGVRTPMGPGETTPAAYGEIAHLAPSYLPPAPAESAPTLPLEPPPES